MVQVLFAHGAGAPSSHPWMVAWAARLGSIGAVTTFDYPYAGRGSRRPDPHAVLVAAHRAALDAMVARDPSAPIVLAGKSMGSRIGCHLAVGDPRPAALVCFGYPLVGASPRKPVRDAVLLALRTPVLFVQGTNDPLCPLDHLERVRAKMTAPNELLVVEGGDHSLQVRKRVLAAQGRSQDDVDQAVQAAVSSFIQTHLE